MLFNSLDFFFFFLALVSVYFFLPHKWQNIFLIVASCLFYAFWSWKFLFLLLFSVTVDFICANRIEKSHSCSARRNFLWLSIGVNLAILGFFKYFNFFIANIYQLLEIFGMENARGQWYIKILLPLGISFYTFEAISYVVDVYRRVIKPADRYLDYVLFILFFPRLIAGPIMRAKVFLPQIIKPRFFSWESLEQGAALFVWGLFEKVFVADNLAKIVDPVFNSPQAFPSGVDTLLALYAFSFQIYCDFDGYSNMARGLARCLGFDIPINFQWPYFATNPREFWQRWHITLSTWLRDYIYIPLGGNRVSVPRNYFNLMVTMVLGGLWHGANWTFILWGVYHGGLLVGHRIVSEKFGHKSRETNSGWKFLKMVILFHAILFGWLLFRAQNMGEVQQFLNALVFDFNMGSGSFMLLQRLLMIISPFLVMQILQYRKNDLMLLVNAPWLVKPMLYASFAYLILGWGVLKTESFIYFQF